MRRSNLKNIVSAPQTFEPNRPMSQAPFVQPKAGGQALHGQLSEGSQHANLHDYILHDHIFGICCKPEEYNKSLMRQISRVYNRSERCGSTSTQLVQLSTPSNIPGVSMVRNTGDSEDHWSCRSDKRVRKMWFHLNTASSTIYTL